jgi:hypothetical protein
MRDALAGLGKKALAVAILIGAAYLLFKLVVGLVSTLVWFLIAVIAVLAVIWAIRTL